MDQAPTEFDKKLADSAEEFADRVAALSAHPVLQEGLVKAALNEAIWALYHKFDGTGQDLADHLDLMGDIVRKQFAEDVDQAIRRGQ